MAEWLIICKDSGTILNLGDCVAVDYDALSDDDRETLDMGDSNASICKVAEREGVAVVIAKEGTDIA